MSNDRQLLVADEPVLVDQRLRCARRPPLSQQAAAVAVEGLRRNRSTSRVWFEAVRRQRSTRSERSKR